jgi:hypothetical protein
MGLSNKTNEVRKGRKYNNRHGNTLSVHLELSTIGIRILDLSKQTPVNEYREFGDQLTDVANVIAELTVWDDQIALDKINRYAGRKGYNRVSITHSVLEKGVNLEKPEYLS